MNWGYSVYLGQICIYSDYGYTTEQEAQLAAQSKVGKTNVAEIRTHLQEVNFAD